MQLGEFQLELVSAGCFSLDGGTVFGVLPKAIWEQQMPADGQNRIRLGTNCLLIRAEGQNILVDCGLGNKFGPKQRNIYQLDQATGPLNTLKCFIKPDEITYLILTHLHFDHAGGVSRYNSQGKLELCFPQARVVVQKREWEAACSPNEHNRGSYLPENIQPLAEAGCLQLVEGDYTLLLGIELLLSGGHSAGHQIVRLTSEGKSALFLGDIIPTSYHLRLTAITAYDVQPEQTLKVKKRLLAQAAEQGWLLIFEHDMAPKMGYIERIGKEDKIEYALKSPAF